MQVWKSSHIKLNSTQVFIAQQNTKIPQAEPQTKLGLLVVAGLRLLKFLKCVYKSLGALCQRSYN